ncbi:hypothetical protein IKF15_01670 [Candidatus Saccharibacteria bacterium]|nr:hypothetical protein [Candidatus Saccharibacteria bacterium]
MKNDDGTALFISHDDTFSSDDGADVNDMSSSTPTPTPSPSTPSPTSAAQSFSVSPTPPLSPQSPSSSPSSPSPTPSSPAYSSATDVFRSDTPNIVSSQPAVVSPSSNQYQASTSAPSLNSDSTTTTSAVPASNLSANSAQPRVATSTRSNYLGRQQRPATPNQVPDFFSQAIATQAAAQVQAKEQAKRKRKPILIASIVGALAIIVLIGALLSAGALKPNTKGQSSAIADLKTKWNRYGNYLIYGKESDEDLPEEVGALSEIAIEESDIYAYYATADTLFSDFQKVYKATDDLSKDEELSKTVDLTQDYFTRARLAYNARIFSYDDFVTALQDYPVEEIKTKIQDAYQVFYKHESQKNTIKTGELFNTLARARMDVIEVCQQIGLEGNDILNCANQSLEPSVVEKRENASDAFSKLHANLTTIRSDLLNSVIETSKKMREMTA